MRIKDAEAALLAGLAGRVPLEAEKDVGQRGGIIPGLSRGADADAVGLALLAAAIAARPGPADDVNGRVDQRAEVFAHHTANDAARQREQAGQDALALLVGAECRWVTWAISWASTPASSSSRSGRISSPRDT